MYHLSKMLASWFILRTDRTHQLRFQIGPLLPHLLVLLPLQLYLAVKVLSWHYWSGMVAIILVQMQQTRRTSHVQANIIPVLKILSQHKKTKQVRSYSSSPWSLPSTTWLYLQLYPYLVLILLRECDCCEFVVLEEEILIDQEINGFLVQWFNGLLLTQGHHALIDLFCGP